MHELSIAMSIIEMAEEEAERRGCVRVTAIHLRLGKLSGVVKDALLSAYEMARESSPLRDTELVVEELAIIVFCPTCQKTSAINSVQLFCCAECGAPTWDIRQGKEMEVVALEIEEWAPNPV